MKVILESPGTMEKILKKKTALEDFTDETFFANTLLLSENLSFLLALYNDDCEMVNPLGSKLSVHKLGLYHISLYQ